MGYKIQFETGHEVDFDTQPSQQDIEDAYNQVKGIPISKQKTTSLVDQIPGLAPEIKAPEDTRTVTQKVGDTILGVGEAGLNVASGATTGMLGGTIGGLGGILDTIKSGTFGTQEGARQSEQAFLAGMEKGTYAPRTEAGKQAVEKVVSPILEQAIPFMGIPNQMGALSSFIKPVKQQLRGVKEVPEQAPKAETSFREESTQKATKQDYDAFIQRELEKIGQERALQNRRRQLPNYPENQEPILVSGEGEAVPMSKAENLEYYKQKAAERQRGEMLDQPLEFESVKQPYEPSILEGEYLPKEEGIPYKQDVLGERVQKQADINDAFGEPTSLIVLNKDKLMPLSDAVANAKSRELPPNLRGEQELFGGFDPQRLVKDIESIYNDIKPETIEEFIQGLRKAGVNTSDDIAELMFNGLKQEQQVETKIKKQSTVNNFVNKITKGKAVDIVDFKRYNPDEVLADLVNGPDSTGTTNFFEKYGMSQGYMPAEASNNPPFQKAVKYLKGVLDLNKTKAEQTLFNDGVRQGNRMGLITALNRLEKFGDLSKGIELNKQWFKAKNNPDYKFSLTPEQQKVHNIKEQVFTEILDNVNSMLPEGKKVEALPNYIPSVHQGKFWGTATILKADGTASRPLIFASDNKFQTATIKRRLEAQGYTTSNVKTRGQTKTDFGTVGANRAADFQYMLDVLSDESPEVRKLYADISREMQGRATTTKGQHQHQKNYSGFEGEVGNRPWLSDKQNYYDMKKMLTSFVEAHYDWMSAQEGAAFAKKVLDPANKVKENNRQNVLNYIDSNVVGKRFTSGIDDVINDLTETLTGASPTQARGVSNTIGAIYTQLMTAFGSGVHALQNVVQPITVLIPQITKEGGVFHPIDALKSMMQGAAEYAYVFSGKQVGEIAKAFGADSVRLLGSKNFNAKMSFAERTGLINPTLVESGSLFENKYANRAYELASQGILSKPSEQAARWTVFSTMADWYQKRGMKQQDAFQRAYDVAETYMVDYGVDAKAGIWKSLGTMGNILGRLQTFATNQFSQLYVYGKNAPKSFNDAAAFASLLGTYYLLAGMSGMPGFDALEEIVNRVKSKEGKTFSLRNYLRQTVGDTAYGGAWELTGLGAAPSFATKSINADVGGVPLPSMLGMPIASKMAEQAGVVGHRVLGDVPWEAETEAEKGRELLTMAPTSLRSVIEDAYLKETVGKETKRISPKTGEPLHTEKPGEFSLGNIRSTERVKSSEISQERYKEIARFNQQKKDKEAEIYKLSYDLFAYGNKSKMKENRMVNLVTKYIKDYSGDPNVLEKDINQMINSAAYFDNEDIAQLAYLGNKSNVSMDDVRKILFSKKYMELRK